MQRLTRIVVRNSAAGMAAQIAIKIISFSFTVLVVRRLGSAAFGQYAAVLAFGMSFAFISDLGLSAYAVREVARLRDQPDGHARISELFSTMLRLRLALSVIASALLLATGWLVGYSPAMLGALALGALGLFTYSIQGVCEAMLAGHERLDLPARAKVIAQVAFVGVGTLALALHAGYYGLIVANQLSIALLMLVCWRAVRSLGIAGARSTKIAWRPLLRASMPFGIISFTLGLSYKFDTVLLSIFRSDVETGYYNAAYSLVFATVVLSNVINTALYPSFSRQAAERLTALYERALRYLLLPALPIAMGASLLADQLIALLYGQAYLPAAGALRVVAWVIPLMYASEFLGYVVLVAGQERHAARTVLVSTSLNIGLNLLLIPWFGLMAAAAMTVVTEAVLVGLYVWRLWPTLRNLRWSMIVGRPLLATCGMGLGVVLIKPHLPLLATVAAGAVAYAALLLALGVVGRDELHFVRHLRANPEAAQ